MRRHPLVKALLLLTFSVGSLRLIPHIILWRCSRNRHLVDSDVRAWVEAFFEHHFRPSMTVAFLWLMTHYPEFRTLFYFRIGGLSRPVQFLCPRMESFMLFCTDLGPGLVIQHGIATVVVSHGIGPNCWINQQVTIGGGKGDGFPILGANVRVSAGAKVLGSVRIGDNAIIGANAVVVKDVPPNVTVVGVPAYIVRRDGVRVHEKL